MGRTRYFFCGAFLALVLGGADARAQVLDTTLTLGSDWTVVRELRRVVLTAGEQELMFDQIPVEADLSTLTVRTRRIPVDLLSWERVPLNPRTVWGDTETVALRPDGTLREATLAAPSARVRCRLAIPVGGTRTLELTYRLTGLSWSARYQVLLRGEPDGREESVSVDMTGWVRIRNTTDHVFDRALIRLVGADPRWPREAEERAGILMLEEGPLADLWKSLRPLPPAEQRYRLPHRVHIPGRSETDSPFIQTHRVPAQRLYVLDSDEIPLSATDLMRPLHTYLVLRNSVAMGLGWTLPPGPVDVFHGTQRRALVQTAFMPHTPVDEEIRVDFGKARDVRGRRRMVLQTPVEFGFYEENFELRIQNDRPNPLRLEIIETPETPLSWQVIRATELFEVDGNRLLMKATAPGTSEKRIEYRLQFHRPTF